MDVFKYLCNHDNAFFQIFSYLTVEDRVLDACLVCKLWNSICFDGLLWQVVDFEDRRQVI